MTDAQRGKYILAMVIRRYGEENAESMVRYIHSPAAQATTPEITGVIGSYVVPSFKQYQESKRIENTKVGTDTKNGL